MLQIHYFTLAKFGNPGVVTECGRGIVHADGWRWSTTRYEMTQLTQRSVESSAPQSRKSGSVLDVDDRVRLEKLTLEPRPDSLVFTLGVSQVTVGGYRCVFRADLGADSGGIWALIPG